MAPETAPGRPAPRAALAVAALALVLVTGAARAQEFGDFEFAGLAEDARREPSPLAVGAHTFKPSFIYKLFGVTTPHVFGAASGGYTDNLLREDGDIPGVHPRRELFARGEAGVRLDTQLSDHRIELEYRGAATDYVETSEFETLEQAATARLDLRFARFDVHGDASWRRTAYPQSIQLRGILRVDSYSASAWTQVGFGKFGVRVGGGIGTVKYLERDLRFLDQRSLYGNLQLYWRLVPKLRAIAEYNWQAVRFDEQDRGRLNDFQMHTVRGGLDGAITAKLSASIKAGATFQDSEGSVNRDSRAFSGFVTQAALRWTPLPRTTLSVSVSRTIGISTTSNFLLTDSISALARQAMWEDRISVTARAGYTRAFVSPGEKLNRLDAGAAVAWNITQWLSTSAAYSWELLRSEFVGDDYEAHTVTVSVGVGF